MVERDKLQFLFLNYSIHFLYSIIKNYIGPTIIISC